MPNPTLLAKIGDVRTQVPLNFFDQTTTGYTEFHFKVGKQVKDNSAFLGMGLGITASRFLDYMVKKFPVSYSKPAYSKPAYAFSLFVIIEIIWPLYRLCCVSAWSMHHWRLMRQEKP